MAGHDVVAQLIAQPKNIKGMKGNFQHRRLLRCKHDVSGKKTWVGVHVSAGLETVGLIDFFGKQQWAVASLRQ